MGLPCAPCGAAAVALLPLGCYCGAATVLLLLCHCYRGTATVALSQLFL